MSYVRLSHKARFTKYRDDSVILKCRRYALWTLPQLMADMSEMRGTSSAVERDYQEIGALLVNNLAAKLASLLFPSNRPFFKIDTSPELKAFAKQNGKSDSELQAGLSRMEMEASQRLFLNASYNQLVMALKHLIITGNVLLYRDSKEKRTVSYGIQSFGIRRDGRGNMIDVVLREYESFAGLSTEMQLLLRAKSPYKYSADTNDMNVEVYTRICRLEKDGHRYFEVTQEIDEVPIGQAGYYPEHLCPWQAPTWSLIIGEHMGRGLVEDFAGGFAKLSDESEALALYGIAAMKFINLVAPGMSADVDELQRAETGEYVTGQAGAITVYETGDGPKIQAMRAGIQETFTNLARAFMYQGNTRDAERVTAYELKQLAMEANTVLGGTYSSLAETMQVPLAHTLLSEVEPGVLEGLISRTIVLNIMAGIPALGRAADVQNIVSACQDAAAIIPVLKQLDPRVDVKRVMDIIYAGQSLDTTTMFYTAQEQKQLEDAEKQAQAGNQQIQETNNLADQAQQLTALGGLQ